MPTGRSQARGYVVRWWMTYSHLVPETGDGIVVLANSQRSWPLFSHLLSDWAHY